MERSRVAIIIPALNEAATIGDVVTSAGSYGTPIVVDDGSSDGTGRVAEAAGAEVVRHEANAGYDQALNSGFRRAAGMGCDAVITMDADGQHDPRLLQSFLDALDSGADVVIGTRDRWPRVAEYLFGWAARIRWGIRDPLCGLKAYRMHVYRELGHFDSYGSIGTELAIFAAKQGKTIAQFPVHTCDRADQPRFGRRFSANRRILHALWFALSR